MLILPDTETGKLMRMGHDDYIRYKKQRYRNIKKYLLLTDDNGKTYIIMRKECLLEANTNTAWVHNNKKFLYKILNNFKAYFCDIYMEADDREDLELWVKLQ